MTVNIVSHRTGHWLPTENHELTRKWLDRLIKHVESLEDMELKHELREFNDLIETDTTLKVLASLMFKEVPTKPPYNNDPLLEPQVRDYHHMLQLVNHIMDSAPKWTTIADEVGLIGFPINAILDWPMCTSSGNAFFLREDVNQQWTKILNRWAIYMTTSNSAEVLNQADGWLSEAAMNALTLKANLNGATDYTFDQLFVCDKTAENYGYKSWDDFFVREFHPDVRPLGGNPTQTKGGNSGEGLPVGQCPLSDIPEGAGLIYNACESTPVYLRRHEDIHSKATFWLKKQPYSLTELLGSDPSTPDFVHGTVYQAFLSALSYHRWHSPVSGTIVRAFNVPGSYFSANYFEGFAKPLEMGGPDEVAPNNSQAYITQVAARAIIMIRADDPNIGLMAFVAVGMCECSSNEITVAQEQHVEAGEQIGMFHFGGSTHCLLFRKGVEVVYIQEPPVGTDGKYDPPPEVNTPLRSTIAYVVPEEGNSVVVKGAKLLRDAHLMT